ncbi:polyprenyl synthetase family protein [Enterococcus dongliensis]|uniref:Farnesyl diphosphate synthase n=1 Tax=Enterococcus dongliensis TaxID=2559925 RepID=A0AAP5NDJ0_9ENTE|nr:farnesyl diphosphate synthase [Enterococcus dongliensis]MDT2596817.1 polyprenyl synthetase family protein [Enterococcus dongliensis]MDT2603165.1 polyprenyl synthetase family protein [Enterococcus dongliensis]MDT2633509.1 polyprenyl synthetase family protein [Enterococcus dongliensis]MDT2636117.1 polyprenyl synthetase family protein [Enterococcus dongliensis]MDT2638977.1 polyprenyl synthetase family protein [Enterococcus dongliensis]
MLQQLSAEELPKVEKEISDFINTYTSHEELKKSMLYSIEAGGKRLRPLIILATVKAFQKELTTPVYQTAGALEMIHTYSLIHDDLPAMDDDDLRRGKLTNHKVFGDALAILAGDGLLTGAFQLLSETTLSPSETVLLIQLLAKAAGIGGMVAGQAGDMAAEKNQIPLKDLQAIHHRKTGALLTYAFVAGGILANQTEYVAELLETLGGHIGLAFQIRDDLLDIVGTTEELGKQIGQDEKSEKSTYPSLLGLEGARQALAEELGQAKIVIHQLAEVAEFQPQIFEEVLTLFDLEK